MPQAASQSRGSSASAAAVSAQRLRETVSSHMSPGSILQPRVPGRSPTLAAKTSRRAVSADHQRSRKTPGAKPTISVQPRFRPASRGSSDQPVNVGAALRIWCPAARGPAPSHGIQIFLLRSSRVRRAFPTPCSELDTTVLQPFLPPGFASRHRARTAMAPAGTLPSAPAGRGSFPRTVS
jgi:hypothetical protein